MEPDDTAARPRETGAETPEPDAGDEAVSRSRPLRWWLCLLIGAAAAAVGLLPWLVGGMRLPLQNLWATDAPPEEYPLVLLPFSQYHLSLIAALLIVGAAIAGIAARATRRLRRRSGVAWTLIGLLSVQVSAIVHTAVVVSEGLEDRFESDLYLAALVAVAVLANLIGVAVMLLVASAPRAGAVIGLAVAAVLSSSWLGGLLLPDPALAGPTAEPVLFVLRWLPAVLVGAAIAWGGIGTVGRVIAAVVALALLWIGPALITAVSSAAGSRVLARRPDEMIDYAVGVFRSASTLPEIVVPPLVVAVAVAAIGLVGRLVVRRSRASTDHPDRSASSAGESPSVSESAEASAPPPSTAD
ncbi:hypothetical protein GCM10017608_32380 [Agromyces luteolus]|uniref:Uncharacterized protein n=1 Tax=Agromyces luteolus TaxID=88373 RepID=A0A7C9LY36_9MICO|nr:hypothetical protein [Agromyces luteolus]MUN06533.1 hypothetical protein [Agromyces luteolus]GLK29302.1 hypothetical protein GCM10017608_32380 [Agromyces luteolus]